MYEIISSRPDCLDREMASAIAQAVIHTRTICLREGVKVTERHERVGLFVTSLRTHCQFRAAPSLKGYLNNYLCNKKIWFDAGVLEPSFTIKSSFRPFPDQGPTHWGPITSRRIEKWVQDAKLALSPEEEEFAEIDNELALIHIDVASLQYLTIRAAAAAVNANRAANEIHELILEVAEL